MPNSGIGNAAGGRGSEFLGKCESCGEAVETEPLVVEREHIGLFCPDCYRAITGALAQLNADATDADITSFLQEEQGGIVELCRQHDQRRN